MKFLPVSFVTALLAVAASAQFTINTPASVVECEPVLITWSGGTAPYFLVVEPGGQPSAAALENLGTQTGTSFTWTVNIASGQSIGFTLRDSTGAIAQTAPVTIQAGGGSACLTATTSATTSGSAAPSTPLTTSGSASVSTPSSTPTTPASTPTTPTPTTPASGTTTHTTTAPTTSTTSSSGAAPTARYAQIGVAGVLGVVVAAIVA